MEKALEALKQWLILEINEVDSQLDGILMPFDGVVECHIFIENLHSHSNKLNLKLIAH